MNLTSPIRSIIPSIDAEVYRVLAATTAPMSGRRVQQLAGVSLRGAQNVLQRLVESGVVDAVEAPPAVLYTANREHLAWPAIEQLTLLRPALAARLGADIAAWSPKPRVAALYGSAARGDGDSGSDIDVFLVVDAHDRDSIEGQIDELAVKVRRWTGNDLQAVVFTPSDVQRLIATKDAVYANIRRDAVVLVGTLVAR